MFKTLYIRFFSSDRVFYAQLKMLLGFSPNNLSLYKTAFRHKSVSSGLQHGGNNSNERLEFLGDAVLGMLIAEVLFRQYPFKDEGFLTETRSKLVNRAFLNSISFKIGLEHFVEFDPKCVGSRKEMGVLGDAFEALIGAIYLDKGFAYARHFLLTRIIDSYVDIDVISITETNHKSRLLEWGAKNGKKVQYHVLPFSQEEDKRLFIIQVTIEDEQMGIGKSYNKKEAERIASEKTFEILVQH